MFTLFKRIRERLLQSRQFSRYLLYALGEVLLVVIGILIALQINNWNEDRKNRHYELTMLSEVKTILERYLQIIQRVIPYVESVQHSIREVVLIKNDSELPTDSLESHLSLINSFGITLSFNKSTY